MSDSLLTEVVTSSANSLFVEAPVLSQVSLAGLTPAPVANFRYPEDVTQPPYDKYVMFFAKRGRHIIRNGTTLPEQNGQDGNVGSVTLYLPEGALNSTLSVQWSDKELGALGGAFVEATAQGAEALGGVLNSDASMKALADQGLAAVDSLKQRFSNTTAQGWLDAVIGVGSTMAARFGSALTGISEEDIANRSSAAFGRKINPRTDVLFDSVRYRTHTMQFVLIPRTQAEAESIDAIIHFFQFYSLPSFGPATETAAAARFGAFMIGYPYEFEVKMFGSRNQELIHANRIGRSVITRIGVNHAQGQKTAFVRAGSGEPYPVATALEIELQEVRLMGRDSDEINRGRSLHDPRS